MGVLRTLPNMTVIMPADYWAARKLVAAAAEIDGPCYLRFTRDAIPVIYDENSTFEIGKGNRLKEGKEVAIIAKGETVRLAIEAAETLSAAGISARAVSYTHLDVYKRQNLDCDHAGRVLQAARDSGKPVITFSQQDKEADVFASQVRKQGDDILFRVTTRRSVSYTHLDVYKRQLHHHIHHLTALIHHDLQLPCHLPAGVDTSHRARQRSRLSRQDIAPGGGKDLHSPCPQQGHISHYDLAADGKRLGQRRRTHRTVCLCQPLRNGPPSLHRFHVHSSQKHLS